MPFCLRALALAGAALFVAGAAEAESLTLAVGEARREPVGGAIANVVVVDPTVADVTVIDRHSVIIMGKGLGSTEIMATDHAGRVLVDDLVTIGGLREDGRVTVYRGVASSDYACMPRCTPLDAPNSRSSTTTTASGGSEGYPAPPMTVAPPVTTTTTQTVAPAHP